MTYTCSIETPLATMTAAARDGALVGLWFEGQKYYPCGNGGWVCDADYPVFGRVRAWLADYFAGKRTEVDVALAPVGSPFQMAVWAELMRIAYGSTTTYGTIAREIARAQGVPSMSAQAVGGAVGRNPISILIPCHRVVGCASRLTGYAGGLELKEALLRLEGVEFVTGPASRAPSSAVRRGAPA